MKSSSRLPPYNIALLDPNLFISSEPYHVHHSTSLKTCASSMATVPFTGKYLTAVSLFYIKYHCNNYVMIIKSACTEHDTNAVLFKLVAVISVNMSSDLLR